MKKNSLKGSARSAVNSGRFIFLNHQVETSSSRYILFPVPILLKKFHILRQAQHRQKHATYISIPNSTSAMSQTWHGIFTSVATNPHKSGLKIARVARSPTKTSSIIKK